MAAGEIGVIYSKTILLKNLLLAAQLFELNSRLLMSEMDYTTDTTVAVAKLIGTISPSSWGGGGNRPLLISIGRRTWKQC
jgi:hypothetical protein